MGAEAPDPGSPLTTFRPLLKVMIVAGEASGDKHAAALAQSLVDLYPNTRFEMFGSGGDEMRRAGVETLVDARDVAIIGIPEIIRALGRLLRAYRALVAAARRRKPDVIVLVDWPDFNLRLARRLHREGFKVAYYISPQVWAWRRHRVKAIRRNVDRMLVILPFEEEFYRHAGIDVEYVGHPLLQAARATASRDEFCSRHHLDPRRPIIALLPGSRKKEIHYHLPMMLEAAGKLRIAECGLRKDGTRSSDINPVLANPQFVVPLAATVDPIQIDQILNKAGDSFDPDVRIIDGESFNALSHSSFAVVASGTATVEAALAGTPMIIVYRASELNWRLIRPLVHLDTFGMVNLIAGRRIVPELIQHEMTGGKIARAVTEIVGDPERLAGIRRDLAEVCERLRSGGGLASHRAASAVIRLIESSETDPL